MKDNVIWVDFSAKRRKRESAKGFLSSIISFFRSPANNSSKLNSRKEFTKAHKSM